MKVLVTGASSLLGRHIVAQLLERGDKVTCFQRSEAGTGATEILGDICDEAAVKQAVRGHEVVVHLAALVAPRPNRDLARAVNVSGTAHVVRAVHDTAALVHISSPSVAFHNTPVAGAGALPPTYRGRDAYAATKAEAERLVSATSTVPTVIVRPHLVWGPDDTQLVGRIIDRARQGRLVLPDHGSALMDTTYVTDAAAAIVAATLCATEGHEATFSPLVVTGADPRPLRELVDGIVRAAHLNVTVRSVPAPVLSVLGRLCETLWPGTEPPLTFFAARQLSVSHWFDQSETQRVLSWKPSVRVDEGMALLEAAMSA